MILQSAETQINSAVFYEEINVNITKEQHRGSNN